MAAFLKRTEMRRLAEVGIQVAGEIGFDDFLRGELVVGDGSERIRYASPMSEGDLGITAESEPSSDPSMSLGYAGHCEAPCPFPVKASRYPELRYMGSKHRLLTWIHEVLAQIDFTSALDPFAGSGCAAYLMKAMGKRVVASDFLNFSATLAKATVENSHCRLDGAAIGALLRPARNGPNFIAQTFEGIFYTPADLRFLDRISANIEQLKHPHQQAVARAALIRSCLKRQPRGVFTVSGDLGKYDDGRRDLRLTLEDHFLEQVAAFNDVVFDNGKKNRVQQGDVFTLRPRGIDLVYLDPPYVPRSDDNCYVKRYHFLEGLSCYWQGQDIDYSTKVRKIRKKYTPFSYRRTAMDAFDRLFEKFKKSIIVLSYSSNGFPDLEVLVDLMHRYKKRVVVHEKPHRYHFGTHGRVERAQVHEYLIVGT